MTATRVALVGRVPGPVLQDQRVAVEITAEEATPLHAEEAEHGTTNSKGEGHQLTARA